MENNLSSLAIGILTAYPLAIFKEVIERLLCATMFLILQNLRFFPTKNLMVQKMTSD